MRCLCDADHHEKGYGGNGRNRSNVPGITKKDRPLTHEHFAEFEKAYGENLSRNLSRASQVQVREGDVDHGFSGGMEEFEVFAESVAPVEPCEGAFDDPPFGQYLERVQLIAFDHFHVIAEHLFGPADQLSGVTAVNEDLRR